MWKLLNPDVFFFFAQDVGVHKKKLARKVPSRLDSAELDLDLGWGSGKLQTVITTVHGVSTLESRLGGK